MKSHLGYFWENPVEKGRCHLKPAHRGTWPSTFPAASQWLISYASKCKSIHCYDTVTVQLGAVAACNQSIAYFSFVVGTNCFRGSLWLIVNIHFSCVKTLILPEDVERRVNSTCQALNKKDYCIHSVNMTPPPPTPSPSFMIHELRGNLHTLKHKQQQHGSCSFDGMWCAMMLSDHAASSNKPQILKKYLSWTV